MEFRFYFILDVRASAREMLNCLLPHLFYFIAHVPATCSKLGIACTGNDEYHLNVSSSVLSRLYTRPRMKGKIDAATATHLEGPEQHCSRRLAESIDYLSGYVHDSRKRCRCRLPRRAARSGEM